MAAAAVSVLVVLIAVGTAANSSRPAVLPTDCGQRLATADDFAPRPRIAGKGNNAAFNGQFPWQARIAVYKRTRFSYVHQCGGIIITRRHVLTAAHCVHDVALSSVQVHVGDNRLGITESAEEVFAVSGFYVHGHYGNGTSLANDIALLRLKVRRGPGIVFGQFVQPACLPEKGVELEVNTPCEVSGWGRTADRGPLSDVLRGVTVPLVSDQFCSSPEVHGSRFIEGRTVCAGEVRGGPDACGGDSGGPLVCPRPSDGRFIAYGIVSSGDPQGCGRLPGLYTKVSGFLDWLLARLRLDDDEGTASTPECGVSNVDLPANVADGQADRADFPWLIAISRSGNGSLSCPATLLSDRWMISSSICTRRLSRAQLPFRAVLHSNKDAPSVSLSIVRRLVHPKFNRTFPGYDMALLQTASPIPLSSRLRPICLADKQLSTELTLVTAAWKSAGNYSVSPAPVRWTKLVVQDSTKCLRRIRTSEEFRTSQDALCGIFRPKRSGFDCGRGRVDLAAPLMTSSVQNGAKRWHLVSLITQGAVECAGRELTTEINVGVRQTVQWILSVITN